MKCIIVEAVINTREGISRAGKPYRMDNQRATLEFPNGERRNIELQHEAGAQALPAGEYEPTGSAFYLDKDRNIVVSRRARHWRPVASSASKAAPARAAA